MNMAYALVIQNPHIVRIEGATSQHLLWIRDQRPGAVFNYGVHEHRPDNTLVVDFHFEEAEEAAIFRIFHG